MKALFAKIPRDRSLLLLLAPVLVLAAFLAAGRSEEQYSALPVGAVAPKSTTSTTAAPFSPEGAAEQSAEVEGSSVSRAGTTIGSRSGSGSSGAGSSGSGAGSGGGSSGAGTTPTSDAPAWVGGGATTTTSVADPGSSTPTTTIVDGGGPDPAVNEVPVAILLPVTALLVLGIALLVVSRRRRRVGGT